MNVSCRLGIGIRTIFEAWKEETRKNIIQTRKNAIAQKNARKLAKDGRMAARVSLNFLLYLI